ncbi:MAG: HAMP domain-containing histidine kinase [Clostridiales bacterium]|nr:HAMP domain-containing histidine kinase [Clostridiales bacterium]
MKASAAPTIHSCTPAADMSTRPASDSSAISALRTSATAALRAKPVTEQDFHRWLSCLSHEIRNPLTLIYSSLQILEKEYPCVSGSPLWEQTKGDIQYLIRLLKDSSAALRDYQPNVTVFSVQEFFEELILSVNPLLHKQQIHIESSIIRNTPARMDSHNQLFVRADRPRLKEALTNLLINAADALSSMPASHDRRIRLYADIPGENASAFCLHVRDNGPGIPEEYLDTLFDPFVTHKSNGTGLGLSIVRNIAELHNGTVSVETGKDTDGTFTDFCLCLPAVFPSFTPGSLPPESSL